MSLRDYLARDAAMMIATFGEDVVYRPFGKAPRKICGLRGPSTDDTSTQWTFANCAPQGISSQELDVDRDRVELALRPNEAPLVRHIVRMVFANCGRITLEVR